MSASLAHLAHLLPAVDRLTEALSPESKERVTRPLERKVRHGIVAMWAEQRRLILEALPAYRARFSEAIGDDELDALWLAIAAATSGPMENMLDEIAPIGIRRGHRAARNDLPIEIRQTIRFDLKHPTAVDFLRQYGATKVAGINQTTRDALRALLTKSAGEGWSYARTAKEIRTRFVGFGGPSPLRHIRDRAELVAVTEVGMAYEHGQQMVIRQLAEQGVGTVKAWLTAGDERVCVICAPAGEQGLIASTELFSNGLDGPLGHPGCRCALQVRVAAEARVAV